MPDMHGIEASKVILAEQPECKIAIFSGARATAELLNDARSEGYEFEILAKPFHRVHYSELEVDVTTAFRQHPGETLWRMLWQAVGIAVLGLPFWIVPLYLSVSGVNALLEHANVRISDGLDGWLRLLIVTPNMHKIHHSRLVKETNSNYSNIFSLWDRVCGTHTAWTDYRSLRYGLEGFDDKRKQRLIGLISEPFRAS